MLYVDAAFGNLADGGSQGGYLVFLADQHNNCNLISWQSKRLKRIVRSTLAAETLAMCEGVDASLMCQQFTLIWHLMILQGSCPFKF